MEKEVTNVTSVINTMSLKVNEKNKIEEKSVVKGSQIKILENPARDFDMDYVTIKAFDTVLEKDMEEK